MWLEIIELRSASWTPSNIECQLDAYTAEREDIEITSYRRVSVSSDFSVHIRHVSPVADERGSDVGLRIAESLRRFGLVKHALWVPACGAGNRPGAYRARRT